MYYNFVSKCFKVSKLRDRDIINTFNNDIIYVRNHPYVYMKKEDEWIKYTKVYPDKKNEKYNLDRVGDINDHFIFKLDNIDDLNSAPAKIGDLIYRNGDSFMYIKQLKNGEVHYDKVLKI